MMVCCMAHLLIAAPGRGQDRTKRNITLEYHNAPFTTVVKAIEQRTGLIIMYELTPDLEKEKVTISVSNQPASEALDLLVHGRLLKWSLKEAENIVRLERSDAGEPAPANLSPLPPDPPRLTGIIKDEKGHPLAGATIAIRNSRTFATTNAEGVFNIQAKEGDIIICTFVSCEPRTIRVSAEMLHLGSLGQITLLQSVSGLDETVVIAYGTTTRRLSTGSVSTVSGEEIQRQPVSNALDALEGKTPGLFVNQSSGAIGSQVNVNIRGQLSIASGQMPLFIIDGVPFTETPINAVGNSVQAGAQGAAGLVDPMNSINPADIESISILKDGDATAIYGSRGANGVILITTKKGKTGKTRLDVNAYSGAGKLTHITPMLNLREYLDLRHQAFANDGLTPTASSAPDLTIWDTTKSINFDKQFIDNTAHQTDITAALSGGDQRLHYLFSNTLRHESPTYAGGFGYNRYASHLSIDNTSLDGRFAVTATVFYTKESNNQPLNDLTGYVYRLPPNYPLYNANGTLNWTGGFTNPLSYQLQTSQFSSENLLANSTLRYTILPGLNAKVSLGYNKITQNNNLLSPKASLNPATSPLSTATYSSNYIQNYIVEPQLDYVRSIAKGKLTATLGGTWQHSSFVQPFFLTEQGFSNDQLLTSMNAAATVLSRNSGFTDYKYASGWARINYTWMDRYLLNFTGRRDGSSRFGPDRQWGNFGSAGAGWIFSNEDWMKKGAPWLSFGKLRGSYGTIGNDQIADYGYLSTYSITNYSYGSPGLYPTRSANRDYGWETNHKIDLGLETGFLHDRILASATWFSSRTSNQLISAPLSSQSGFSSYQANLPALVQSTGWEFELKTVNLRGTQVSWTSSFNLTTTSNKLVSFPGIAGTSYSSFLVVGKPINLYTGYHYTGVKGGVATVADLNGDGNITQGLTQSTLKGDFKIIGVQNPRYYGGFSNTLTYNRFQLDILFQFVKQLKPSFRKILAPVQPGGLANQDTHILSDGFTPSANVSSPASAAYLNYYMYSDAVYSDASFIRLRNVSLAYDLPAAWIKAIKIQSAGLFIRGQNLLTITHYFGFDPETGGTTLPPQKQIVAGIHCSL